jgi:nitroreductase
LPRGRFGSYTDKIKEMYNAQTSEEHFAHTARQTYIALGLAMAQAAELKIDSTPAEGFSNEVVDNILNLKESGLKSVSLLYLGYRDAENDWLSTMKKVRVPMEDFIIKK